MAEGEFEWETKSWWLGREECNIEFFATSADCPVTADRLEVLEQRCNEAIARHSPVRAHLIDTYANSADPLEKKVYEQWTQSDLVRKSKYAVGEDLEARHFGAKRVVEIEGIDMNECCGTHVTNLACLHLIKITRTERARGCVRAHFVAGAGRVTKLMAEKIKIERELCDILSCGPEQFVGAVSALQTSAKALSKEKKDLLTEIAQSVATHLFSLSASHSVLHSHRNGGDLGYLQLVCSLLRDPKRPVTCLPKESVLFLTCVPSEGSSEGLFLISTDTDLNQDLKAKISLILDGKGGGKKGMFQGKCKNVTPIAIESVSDLLKSQK